LSTGGFLHVQCRPDLWVWLIEDVAQQVRCTLPARQSLKHQQERGRERRGELTIGARRVDALDWLG
jgi:hypothetical protein